MRYKSVVCAIIVATLAFFPGCNKKGSQPGGKKGAGIPELSKKSSLDTSDIFKEFYSDDTSGQGASKKSSAKAASKTFSPASASSGDFQENGRYVVQVSCVQAKSFAEKVISTLKEKNFPAYVAEVQNPTPALTGTFYRIRIGGFGGFSSAKTFGDNTLVPGGYEYWIDKRSNDNTGMEGYGLGSGAAAASPSTNNQTPSGSWSGSAPAASPAPEPPSSSTYDQPDYNAASSAPAPTPPSPAQPAASPGASAPSKNVPVTTPAATTPASPSSPSPATSATTKTGGKGPVTESSDWGADSAASSSSSGW